MSRALRTRGFRTGGHRPPPGDPRPVVLAVFPALLFVLTIAAISPPRPAFPSALADSTGTVLGAAAPTEEDTVADDAGVDCLGAIAGRNTLALLPIPGALRVLSDRVPLVRAIQPEASRAPPAAL